MSIITDLVGISGFLLIIVMFALSFIFGFAYRWILKQAFPRTNRSVSKNITNSKNLFRSKDEKIKTTQLNCFFSLYNLYPFNNPSNINPRGRRVRAGCGVILLIYAITTTRSPRVLFFAGFCFFEAIFSRCGLYAAIGRNDCPL